LNSKIYYLNGNSSKRKNRFDILASGKTDYHCKVIETLFIQDLQPALKANVSSEKLLLV